MQNVTGSQEKYNRRIPLGNSQPHFALFAILEGSGNLTLWDSNM